MALLFLQLFLSAVFAENIREKGKTDKDAAGLGMYLHKRAVRQRTEREILLIIEEMVGRIFDAMDLDRSTLLSTRVHRRGDLVLKQ